MDRHIVFCDVDGTLLSSEGKVLPGTLEAIRSLQAQGIPFVIISGRSAAGIFPIMQEYGLSCPVICMGGALILDEEGHVLYRDGFTPGQAADILDFIEKRGFDCSWNLYTGDRWIVKDENDPRVVREERIVRAKAQKGFASDLDPDDRAGKILCICDSSKIPEIEQEIREAFPDCSVARSSDILLEIMPGSVSKSGALKRMCALKGLSAEDSIAFGDHYNDMDMLESAGTAFLMGNAPEELKSRIANVTEDNDHEGIYKALKKTGLIR